MIVVVMTRGYDQLNQTTQDGIEALICAYDLLFSTWIDQLELNIQ